MQAESLRRTIRHEICKTSGVEVFTESAGAPAQHPYCVLGRSARAWSSDMAPRRGHVPRSKQSLKLVEAKRKMGQDYDEKGLVRCVRVSSTSHCSCTHHVWAAGSGSDHLQLIEPVNEETARKRTGLRKIIVRRERSTEEAASINSIQKGTTTGRRGRRIARWDVNSRQAAPRPSEEP